MKLHRRDFLKTSAWGLTAAAAAARPDRTRARAQSRTPRPAEHQMPDVPEFRVDLNTSPQESGLVLLFNGLIAFMLKPDMTGEAISAKLIKVGLVKGGFTHRRHYPALYLPNDGVDLNKSTAIGKTGCDYIKYPLKGVTLTIGTDTDTVQYSYRPGDMARPWADMGWAFDPLHDLDMTANPAPTQTSPIHHHALVELKKGALEYAPALGPGIVKPYEVQTVWGIGGGKTKKVKQIVRYRVEGDEIPLVLTPWNGGRPSTIVIKNPRGQRVTGGLLHLPTEKMDEPEVGDELTEATIYYRLLKDRRHKSGPKSLVWREPATGTIPWHPPCHASSKARDSVECSCCPPGIIPEA